jgi:hypothetical protein
MLINAEVHTIRSTQLPIIPLLNGYVPAPEAIQFEHPLSPTRSKIR